MSVMKFDPQKADDLKRKMAQEYGSIESDLKRMADRIDQDVHEWWIGDSAESFIGTVQYTKNEIIKLTNQCLANFDSLINSIKQNKLDSETQLASRINNTMMG